MDGFKRLNVHVRGVASLIAHNGELANPLTDGSRLISELQQKYKKPGSKTDQFYRDLAALEFRYGMYWMEDGKRGLVPCLPEHLLTAAIEGAARKSRKGDQARVGIIIPAPAYPIIYPGPTTVDEMFKAGNGKQFVDQRMMTVGQSKILRTRPIFRTWELRFEVEYDPEVLNEATVRGFVETTGRVVGFGDSRPRHGRFEVVAIK